MLPSPRETLDELAEITADQRHHSYGSMAGPQVWGVQRVKSVWMFDASRV
jgi:hypothetical protein